MVIARDAVTGQFTEHGSNMDTVKTQVADVVALPKGAVKDVMRRPVVLVGAIFLAVTFVLILEAYKPGIVTNPIRRLLRAIGLKTA